MANFELPLEDFRLQDLAFTCSLGIGESAPAFQEVDIFAKARTGEISPDSRWPHATHETMSLALASSERLISGQKAAPGILLTDAGLRVGSKASRRRTLRKIEFLWS